MKARSYPSLFLMALLFVVQTNGQVPVHNSYPGAQAVVFLDFDGHTVSGTSWNWNGPIHCGPSGLAPEAITEIANRIAEDYRPFAVNVTTDSSRFLSAPLNRRMRIIFTTSSEWYGNAGGVSMIGSFSWGDDTPAFVFSALLNYNPQRIAEAGSHEAGHTLGLYHQVVYDNNCIQVAEYNSGAGAGEIGWAPIMGVGYYRNMTVWHNGPIYQGCNTVQDELAFITGMNGISFRSDDHSNDFKQATNVQTNSAQFSASGIIETAADVDVFKLNLRNDAQFQVSAVPFSAGMNSAGSNLDIQLSLYDRRKVLIGQYNPQEFLQASIDTFLESGTYYLFVEGVGNQYTPDYASIGAYSLQGSLGSASRGTPLGYSFNETSLPAKPSLVGTLVNGELQVQSPGNFRYVVTDLQGMVRIRGNVMAGRTRITLPALSSGIYLVRFEDGRQHFTEKFMKQ